MEPFEIPVGDPQDNQTYRANSCERAGKYAAICADSCAALVESQENLRDILTDLRHYAVQKGLDFDEAVIGSLEVWQEETE
jgi:hypothetical protein